MVHKEPGTSQVTASLTGWGGEKGWGGGVKLSLPEVEGETKGVGERERWGGGGG